MASCNRRCSGEQDLVRSKLAHGLQDIRADAAGSDRTDQDLGVEVDPHRSRDVAKHVLVGEIARRFGKGHDAPSEVFELAQGQLTTKASRTKSLRLRPLRSAARSSSRPSSGSRRIVSAELFMSDIVIRPGATSPPYYPTGHTITRFRPARFDAISAWSAAP